ncbi:MAG: TolC family protein [Pedosphaera sp.]|nr:TolC family protein [Pedosphaera sp.]
MLFLLIASFCLTLCCNVAWANGTNGPAWPDHPLSLPECLDVALRQNPTILKSKQDVEESQAIALQLQSIYRPRASATGAYSIDDEGKIEKVPFGPNGFHFRKEQNWLANLQFTQPVLGGGRLKSAARSARLTREAAAAQHAVVVNDALLQVRTAYSDVLMTAEQITVRESAIGLLEQELADTRRRYDAGVAPRFNVLRAEVELANARPPWIRARNAYRIAKINLANLLGWNLPAGLGEEVPLTLAGKLELDPYSIDLANALAKGLAQRPELAGLRTTDRLRKEEIIQARSAFYPQLEGVAGYGIQNRIFAPHLSDEVHGWTVGAQATWDLWDFGLTRGKVRAATARKEKARLEIEDIGRRIELEVRTAHSFFIEAKEVQESQTRAIEQAEEALRLATARTEAGSGTQLEVLSAQTALTQARTTYNISLHDYAVARARLDRATGQGVRIKGIR